MRSAMWMAVLLAGAMSMGCSAKAQVKVASAPPPAPKVEPKPEPKPEPKQVTYLEISDRIQFEPGRAVLLEQSKKVLDEVAESLTSHADIDQVEVEGHTDWLGAENQNLDLSERRAETVKSYLVSKGIGADRLVAHGYGEMKPIADNNTAEGREVNRRVSFRVVKQGGQVLAEKPQQTASTGGSATGG